jgi:hypothetical protein
MIFNRQDAKGRQKKISDQNLTLASWRLKDLRIGLGVLVVELSQQC